MPDQAPPPSPGSRLLPWLLLYALLIVYASTVIGPTGLHFVPLDAASAWRDFVVRAFTWTNNGSDQRADWMGNLSMYVLFGYLLTGVLQSRRDPSENILCAISTVCSAFALSLTFVLAVKFAQIFFPPRTVTLNYVVAQSVGSLVGIAAFGLLHGRITSLVWREKERARENLKLALRLYCVALFVFFLMPLDFALSPDDLLAQFNRLTDIVSTIPDAGRPPAVRTVMLAAGAIATVPFGMLLVLGPHGHIWSLATATVRGFGWMAMLLMLSTLLISGAPTLASLVIRTAGIALGAWSMRWLVRQDADRVLDRLRLLSIWASLPYLVLLLAVNGLLSIHWRGPAEVVKSINPLGLLPFFDYYIVSKADAAKNIVAHAVMYAPLGLFVWLRGARPTRALFAAIVLASIVEVGRYMRPGLEGDMNAVAVAGLAALLTVRLMPGIWWMLEGVTRPKGSKLPR
jgi:VanZ family protein